MQRVYLDHAATTPLDPRVREAMQRSLGETWANPSSLHERGRQARAAVEEARERVAGWLGADPDEVVFTASGTEAAALALLGAPRALPEGRRHVITSRIEHPAVLEACARLEGQGFQVTRLPPDEEGILQPGTLERALQPTTGLVSLMAANNVVGTLQPVRELAGLARRHGALFHTDAVQAAGKVPLEAHTVDLLSVSAHKIHGPKGVGALFVRRGVELHPLVPGGGQERGLRSGTENVPALVGFGVAARLAQLEGPEDAFRLVGLRDRLIAGVLEEVPGACLFGHRYRRLPGHACFGFAGLEGEAIRLLLALDVEGIEVSTGSACSAHRAAEASHVLVAMGLGPVRARGGLRVSLGRFTTEAEIDRFLHVLPEAVRLLNPVSSRLAAAPTPPPPGPGGEP